MADKISKKNIAENSTEVSLKTPSDFQSPSNYQELQSSNKFDGNTISACFSNILEKCTIKQVTLWEVLLRFLQTVKVRIKHKLSVFCYFFEKIEIKSLMALLNQ